MLPSTTEIYSSLCKPAPLTNLHDAMPITYACLCNIFIQRLA